MDTYLGQNNTTPNPHVSTPTEQQAWEAFDHLMADLQVDRDRDQAWMSGDRRTTPGHG